MQALECITPPLLIFSFFFAAVSCGNNLFHRLSTGRRIVGVPSQPVRARRRHPNNAGRRRPVQAQRRCQSHAGSGCLAHT